MRDVVILLLQSKVDNHQRFEDFKEEPRFLVVGFIKVDFSNGDIKQAVLRSIVPVKNIYTNLKISASVMIFQHSIDCQLDESEHFQNYNATYSML